MEHDGILTFNEEKTLARSIAISSLIAARDCADNDDYSTALAEAADACRNLSWLSSLPTPPKRHADD